MTTSPLTAPDRRDEVAVDVAIGGKHRVSVSLEFLWAIRERAELICNSQELNVIHARKIIEAVNNEIRKERV